MADHTLITGLGRMVLAAPPRLGSVRLVTVDGPSGSGKSTLASTLVEHLQSSGLDAVLVRTDAFATWDDPFGWWERLESGVLAPLAGGRPGSYLANDWSGGEPVPRLPHDVPVPTVVVLEGVSAGRRAGVDRAGTAVWVEHPDRAGRLARAVARDGEQIRQHLVAWQLAEDAWFDLDGARNRADLVVTVS